MSSSPEEITEASAQGVQDAGGAWYFVRDYGLLGIFLAIVYAIIRIINNMGEAIFAPISAFASGLSDLIEDTFFAHSGVVDAGGSATEMALNSGRFGLVSIIFGTVVTMVSIYAFWWFLQKMDLRPWKIITGLRGR